MLRSRLISLSLSRYLCPFDEIWRDDQTPLEAVNELDLPVRPNQFFVLKLETHDLKSHNGENCAPNLRTQLIRSA